MMAVYYQHAPAPALASLARRRRTLGWLVGFILASVATLVAATAALVCGPVEVLLVAGVLTIMVGICVGALAVERGHPLRTEIDAPEDVRDLLLDTMAEAARRIDVWQPATGPARQATGAEVLARLKAVRVRALPDGGGVYRPPGHADHDEIHIAPTPDRWLLRRRLEHEIGHALAQTEGERHRELRPLITARSQAELHRLQAARYQGLGLL